MVFAKGQAVSRLSLMTILWNIVSFTTLLIFLIGSIVTLDTSLSPFFDQAPFWNIILSVFALLIEGYFAVQCYLSQWNILRTPLSARVMLYLEWVFITCGILYAFGGSSRGFVALGLLSISPAVLDVPPPVVFAGLLVAGIMMVLIVVDAEYDFGFLRFYNNGGNPHVITTIFTLASVLIHTGVALVILVTRINVVQEERDRDIQFTRDVLAAYLGQNFTDADRALAQRLEVDPEDETAITLQQFGDVLSNWSAYVPATVRDPARRFQDEDQQSEPDDDELQLDEFEARGADDGKDGDDTALKYSSGVNAFRKRQCTVLHVTVLNFPHASPKEAVNVTSAFIDAVVPSVIKYDGVIDTFTPHTIVASFNCHVPCYVRHPKMACQAALEITDRLRIHTDIELGIAVDTGSNLGGRCGLDSALDRRRAIVVVGESVLLSRHLARLTRRLRCSILVTERVHAAVSEAFELMPVDAVCAEPAPTSYRTAEAAAADAAGDRSLTIYELRGSRRNAIGVNGDAYAKAFSAFRRHNYDEVLAVLPHELESTQLLPPWSNIRRGNTVIDHLRSAHAVRLSYLSAHMRLARGETDPKADPKPEPEYMRREMGWEEFPGEQEVNAIINRAVENAGTNADAVEESEELLNAGRQELAVLDNTIAALKKQTDAPTVEAGEGLFSLFVAAEDDAPDDAGNDNNNNQEAEENLDGELPTTFLDHGGGRWQRSKGEIGEGAFSRVFMCLDETGAPAAMKCFSLASRITNVEELQKEARVLSTLRHENIVSYVTAALVPTHFLLLMENVPGGSLFKLLQTFGSLPLSIVRRYARDMLRGLQYLHDNGIVHCDVKPHNVLLSNEGVVKVSDFGSAVNAQSHHGDGAAAATPTAEDFTVRGTSWYMAPEAARNDPAAPPSDVWSFGITVVELLSGKKPWSFSGSEANFIRELGKNETMVPRIPSADELGDEAAYAMVQECCQRDPALRPSLSSLLAHPFFVS